MKDIVNSPNTRGLIARHNHNGGKLPKKLQFFIQMLEENTTTQKKNSTQLMVQMKKQGLLVQHLSHWELKYVISKAMLIWLKTFRRRILTWLLI